MFRVAVVIMVKNEAARIAVTIASCNSHSFINGIIIYDTGSTDETLAIVEKTATVPVSIGMGKFVNFEVTRNECLAFANNIATVMNYTHLFLLDANDELVFEESFDATAINQSEIAWHVSCIWKTSTTGDKLEYKNLKFIKAGIDAKWRGVVHEYLDTNGVCPSYLSGVHVYQDRVADNDGKTANRWIKDRILLQNEVDSNPLNTRAVYYLAQTCECLGDLNAAYKHFSVRSLQSNGFFEEVYHSLYRCGIISEQLNLDFMESIQWYTRAYTKWKRAEPLIAISKIFARVKQFDLAHLYAKLATTLNLPESALLFVDRECYDYERWHQLGIVSWYASNITDGVLGCSKAIDARRKTIDLQNLEYYTKFINTSNDALI